MFENSERRLDDDLIDYFDFETYAERTVLTARRNTATESSKSQEDKNLKDIFMVRLDWSTTDADGIDTELYEDYDQAYDRYKEIITDN